MCFGLDNFTPSEPEPTMGSLPQQIDLGWDNQPIKSWPPTSKRAGTARSMPLFSLFLKPPLNSPHQTNVITNVMEQEYRKFLASCV